MRKKVCHLSYNHDPFDDRIYWKEALTLKEAGYEVTHICVGNEELDFITNEGIRIIQVQKSNSTKNIWLSRGLHFFFRNNKTIDTILQKAKLINADIYHYHDLQLNALVYKIKELPNSPKIIYDAHEAYHLILKQNNSYKIGNFLNRIIVRVINNWELRNAALCDLIITTDNYTQEYFKKKLEIVLVINIYNYSYFNTTYIEKEKRYDFLYTGLINEARGISQILYALNKVKEQIRNVQLLMIGSFEKDSYRQIVDNIIIKLELENNVTIKPSVPFNQIRHYYEISKIGLGIFKREPNYETSIPIKLFEYMANGLPVIFSNFGPPAAIIKKEQCGILVEVDDINSISTAMIFILSNENVFTELSTNGKIAVSQKYNWQQESQKLINVYHDLIKN